MVPFSFAGHAFMASADGALYWPAEQALLVADLHLEKASWFARLGQMLPPYDSLATLSALALAVEASGARRLICLGDSFHDRLGCERLGAAARDLLLSLTGRLDWWWIMGNHDPGLADPCGGRPARELRIGGLVLRHEAEQGDPTPEISGHFHPRLRLTLRGRQVSRRCYVASPTKLVLPAFGALTGGLDAAHPAITGRLGSGAAALVPVDSRMLRFPLAG